MSGTRLGEILVRAGCITGTELEDALAQQALSRTADALRLSEILRDRGAAEEGAIAEALARHLSLPLIDLSTVPITAEATRAVPRHIALRHDVLPMAVDGEVLSIAMADPTDVVAVDDVRTSSGFQRVRISVATLGALREASDRIYSVDSVAAHVLRQLGPQDEIQVIATEAAPLQPFRDEEVEPDDPQHHAPAVALANALLGDAVRGRATDIHIEPQPTEVRIRYRVDGLLREVMTLPKNLQQLITSRVKIISGMNIAERRRPQDGRSKVVCDGRAVDTRVSTVPTAHGEKIVIRLLGRGDDAVQLDELGLEATQRRVLEEHLSQPQGLVIFTGPTGAGKTSTMYSAIRFLQDPSKNIVSLEDPIEYEIAGLSQIQIDEKGGLTFPTGLRSLLRQDPDVVMVGEIRDLETAQMVTRAALTGHLVLSSLHTLDAASAVERLLGLGIEPFRIATALSVVVAQRLVRKVCPSCARPAEAAPELLGLLHIDPEELQGAQLMEGAGCERCGHTGYLGRTGIFEILPVNRAFREQIVAQGSHAALLAAAERASTGTLLAAGMRKVRAGETTLQELLRVAYVEKDEELACPTCLARIEASFVVCPMCETDLEGRSCDGCGHAAAAEWVVCPYCRTGLDPTPAERLKRELGIERPKITALARANRKPPAAKPEAPQIPGNVPASPSTKYSR